jgi:Flp pilus assembly pilin Flp
MMMKLLDEWARDDAGAVASEYAIALAFIAVAIFLAVSQFNLAPVFEALNAQMTALLP